MASNLDRPASLGRSAAVTIVQPHPLKLTKPAFSAAATMMAPSPPSSPGPHRNSLLARRGFTNQSLTLSFDSIDPAAPSGEDLRSESWTDDNLARLFDLGISIGSEAASNLADPTSTTASPECHRGGSSKPAFSPLLSRINPTDFRHRPSQGSSPCHSDTLLSSPLDSAIGAGFDSAASSAGFEAVPSNAALFRLLDIANASRTSSAPASPSHRPCSDNQPA